MRAYDLAMVMIFINCAFPILGEIGITSLNSFSSNFWLLNLLSVPLVTLGPFTVTGIIAIAGVLAGGTIVLLNSNAITDRGMAIVLFAVIFWGSIGTAMLSLSGMILHFDGMIPMIFYTIFLLASTLIFINSLVQFPTGGQGGHI